MNQTILKRWLRFNSVGAIGTIVQLLALALAARLVPTHPLLDTALALEVTLLHNFVWHRRFTWPAAPRQPWLAPLARFHVASGSVSLVMALLMTQTRLPLLLANVVAIVVSGLANFALSNLWAFAATEKQVLPIAT